MSIEVWVTTKASLKILVGSIQQMNRHMFSVKALTMTSLFRRPLKIRKFKEH
jgi:hypothetical protein